MKLYFAPGACSLAPHIVLNELGMTYETSLVNFKDKTCSDGDFTQINKKGYVPALKLDNNEVLTEGVVIMKYLADLKPEANLVPKAGTPEMYRCMEWMNYISTEIHKSFSPLFAVSHISANLETQNEIKTFYKANLARKFDFINEKLAKNDFIMGSQFTIVDAYLFTCLSWNKYVDIDYSKWSNIGTYMTRVYKRDSVQKAMGAEGTLK